MSGYRKVWIHFVWQVKEKSKVALTILNQDQPHLPFWLSFREDKRYKHRKRLASIGKGGTIECFTSIARTIYPAFSPRERRVWQKLTGIDEYMRTNKMCLPQALIVAMGNTKSDVPVFLDTQSHEANLLSLLPCWYNTHFASNEQHLNRTLVGGSLHSRFKRDNKTWIINLLSSFVSPLPQFQYTFHIQSHRETYPYYARQLFRDWYIFRHVALLPPYSYMLGCMCQFLLYTNQMKNERSEINHFFLFLCVCVCLSNFYKKYRVNNHV